ncbi:SusC/RagA family TonB-linked outer membrane protein [Flagellimonas zhangzhouensis]|uniref:TonB-linked outer membrane protein, SusC/RagA family n=1 Tax=Flagellimonas zhangzhouensis TaxID=1073328 RepID=A0A1H2YAR7_9FLAO|nr:TonB-dependent receptor [Allomuricauda zhangzhouensis]SDQ97680.1 TonB-linked outer membrane protein, SusC/RagA family [Allomuricauda zhangzhouensis]SDX02236.1 TonB-linked outer membrane protein, SusC/RagA family [Allomuricauda zhangzhouensis]
MNQNKIQILARWADSFKTFQAFILSMTMMLVGGSALAATPDSDETPVPFQITITGTVVDAMGAPLPGTNVIVKGTTNGTQADFDGNYSITAASDATLIFSYVGFKTVEIPVNGNATVDVTMEEDAAALDEVVVTGYGTQTRGELTGSVASVDVAEATKTPVVNAAEALQGRVSGVTITNNGSPGATPVVRIRGYGTGNSNDPLYIIDGVQTDDPGILNSINPADIQQMNVLKDGAAAIYGARASNGVVIVTTKSGGYNLDNAKVSLDMYTGFSTPAKLPDMLNTQQHGEMIWQSILNDGGTPQHPQYGTGASPVIPETIQGVPVTMIVPNGGTNWLDEIYRSAVTQNVSLTMENGNEKSKFLFSASYLNRQGIQIHTGFKRGSVRLNSEFKVGDRIRIGQHTNISFDRRSGGGSWNNFALRMSPLVPVYDTDGNFGGNYSNDTGLSNPNNPVAEAYRQKDNFAKTFRVFGDVYATLDILDGLQFKTSLGGSIRAYNDRRFRALIPESSEPISTNTLTEADQDTYEWVWTNTLSYNKSFGDHSINALVGIEALDVHGKGKEISRTDYFFETPDYYLLSNGGGAPNVAYSYDNASSLFSLFGTVNYDYDGRYLLTATVRRDESSRFSGDNKSDIFPSVSAGWVVSNEDFWPMDSFVSRFKLKGSWGQMGNQTLPVNNPTINISALSEQYANYVYSGSGGATQGALLSAAGNPNLKWETSETTNFGVELGFFDNRLNLSAEYFTIKTKDLINQDGSLFSSTAIDATPPYVNLGSIENKGVDATLSYSDQTDSGFSYGIDVNFSSYKNEVVDLISAFQTGFGGFRTTGTVTRTEEGHPLSSFYGRVVEGIFSSESEVSGAADQGFATAADGVGRFRYADLNNDGVINDDDRTYIGSPHPDFTYGVNISLGYKGFDMSAFFQGSQGNEIFNNEKVYTDFPSFFNANRSTRVLDSWTPDNQDASLPALSQSITNNEGQANSFFVEDGSYMRLKNLQIGYTFSDDVASYIGMDSVRFYVQGTNLFTITGYDGVDPELQPRFNNNGSIDNLTIGVSDNNYPLASIYSFGVNLKF